jgi:glutamate racemase
LPNEKMNEARSQTVILSWTHYRILTQVEDTTARKELIIKFPFVTNAIAEILGSVDMNDTLDDDE